jgi:hypothetical protein
LEPHPIIRSRRNFVTTSSGMCRLLPIFDPPLLNYRTGSIPRGTITTRSELALGSRD